jgi:hypothetical protein
MIHGEMMREMDKGGHEGGTSGNSAVSHVNELIRIVLGSDTKYTSFISISFN